MAAKQLERAILMDVTVLKEMIEDQIERYRSILGLPRRSNYTLIQDTEYLLKIVKNNSSLNDMEVLICKEFNIKKNTFNYVLPTVERANLIMKTKNNIRLTYAGEQFIQTKNISYVVKGFIENYFGLLEALLLIAENPLDSRKEIFLKWVTLYEAEFGNRAKSTHKSQFNIILRYLIGFDLLFIDGGGDFKINYDLLSESKQIAIF